MPTHRTLAAACLLAAGALTACGPAAPPNAAGAPAPTSPPAPPARFSMTLPKGGVEPVLATRPVTFAATGGVIEGVEVARADGATLPPAPGPDGLFGTAAADGGPTRWRLTGVLGPRAEYRVAVRGRNADGATAATTFTFTTGAAPLVEARLSPGDDDVVGVGMPVQVRFRDAVPDRAAAQRHLKIKTTPAVAGSWGWIDDETVMFRPKGFWPAGTKVAVAYDASGAHLGRGAFGGATRTVRFAVGRDLRMHVSNASHSLTVTQAGRQIGRFPVSLGKPGHTTRSGTKIVYEKQTPYTMRGDASDPYVTTVKHAQRITDSGEFLHAAPWSVGDQGRRNVSHGCTNLSPADAAWLYARTIKGDPVVTTGTSKRMQTWDGLGGVWNHTWPQWQRLSAL